jgi:RNase P subunit RPR2
MRFTPDLSAPVCSDCGVQLRPGVLTEKRLAWALEFGVRCDACAEDKWQFYSHLKQANRERRARAVEEGRTALNF